MTHGTVLTNDDEVLTSADRRWRKGTVALLSSTAGVHSGLLVLFGLVKGHQNDDPHPFVIQEKTRKKQTLPMMITDLFSPQLKLSDQPNAGAILTEFKKTDITNPKRELALGKMGQDVGSGCPKFGKSKVR